MLLNPFLKTDLIFQRYKIYEYNLYYILKFSFSFTRLKPRAFSLDKFYNQIDILVQHLLSNKSYEEIGVYA